MDLREVIVKKKADRGYPRRPSRGALERDSPYLTQGGFYLFMKKRERMTFQIEPELKKHLEKYAELDGRTISNLVQKILDDWVREKGKEKEIPAEKIKKGA